MRGNVTTTDGRRFFDVVCHIDKAGWLCLTSSDQGVLWIPRERVLLLEQLSNPTPYPPVSNPSRESR
jgi:hypothetical protein